MKSENPNTIKKEMDAYTKTIEFLTDRIERAKGKSPEKAEKIIERDTAYLDFIAANPPQNTRYGWETIDTAICMNRPVSEIKTSYFS